MRQNVFFQRNFSKEKDLGLFGLQSSDSRSASKPARLDSWSLIQIPSQVTRCQASNQPVCNKFTTNLFLPPRRAVIRPLGYPCRLRAPLTGSRTLCSSTAGRIRAIRNSGSRSPFSPLSVENQLPRLDVPHEHSSLFSAARLLHYRDRQ